MPNFVKLIIENNKREYNYLKLIEELTELNEVLIKRITKKSENAPSKDKLIEEMGDVLLRMKVVAQLENISADVNKRVNDKADKIVNSIYKGKYKGGI